MAQKRKTAKTPTLPEPQQVDVEEYIAEKALEYSTAVEEALGESNWQPHDAPRTYNYVRASTSAERQNIRTQQLDDDSIIERVEYESGATLDRPVLLQTIRDLRAGDTLTMLSVCRLARSALELLNLVKALVTKGVTVEFRREQYLFTENLAGLDEADKYKQSISWMMLSVVSHLSEIERNLFAARRREGIEKAKAKGDVYKGRVDKFPYQRLLDNWHAYELGALSIKGVADNINMSKTQTYNVIKKVKAGEIDLREKAREQSEREQAL